MHMHPPLAGHPKSHPTQIQKTLAWSSKAKKFEFGKVKQKITELAYLLEI